MKKKGFILMSAVLFIAVAAATGCAGSGAAQSRLGYVQDNETSWQEQALVMTIPPRDGGTHIGDVLIVNSSNATLVRTGNIGVFPAGNRTLYVKLLGYTNSLRPNTRYETTTPLRITYNFQPGGKYVLYSSVTRGFLGVGIDYELIIMPLEEYYATRDESTLDKNWKAKHVPETFAAVEAELSSRN